MLKARQDIPSNADDLAVEFLDRRGEQLLFERLIFLQIELNVVERNPLDLVRRIVSFFGCAGEAAVYSQARQNANKKRNTTCGWLHHKT